MGFSVALARLSLSCFVAETWDDIARANRTAAVELYLSSHWRSCASRCYYAVYSAATHELLAAGVAMPADRNNPRHKSLPVLIGKNLSRLAPPARWRMASLVSVSYRLRIAADYQPNVTFDRTDARTATSVMMRTFRLLQDRP